MLVYAGIDSKCFYWEDVPLSVPEISTFSRINDGMNIFYSSTYKRRPFAIFYVIRSSAVGTHTPSLSLLFDDGRHSRMVISIFIESFWMGIWSNVHRPACPPRRWAENLFTTRQYSRRMTLFLLKFKHPLDLNVVTTERRKKSAR